MQQRRQPSLPLDRPPSQAILGIILYSSHEQVVKAAKEMRGKMHPNRRKRRRGLSEEEMRKIGVEAALVGPRRMCCQIWI